MRCHDPVTIRNPNKNCEDGIASPDTILVPCGKCVACQVNKRTILIYRLLNEYKDHSCACMVTLTYACHAMQVLRQIVNPETGEIKMKGKMVKDTYHVQVFQKFMKRLRKKVFVRFMMVAEYGSKFGRFHHHVIIFGLDCYNNRRHLQLVESAWQMGFVYPTPFNYRSATYVAGYLIYPNNLLPEERPWMLISKNPAIGMNWLDKSKIQWYKDDPTRYYFPDGNFKKPLYRVYRKYIEASGVTFDIKPYETNFEDEPNYEYLQQQRQNYAEQIYKKCKKQ